MAATSSLRCFGSCYCLALKDDKLSMSFEDLANYGKFHKGDSYIVLKTVESDSGPLAAGVLSQLATSIFAKSLATIDFFCWLLLLL